MRNTLASALFVLVLVMGLTAGWVGGSINPPTRSTYLQQATTTTPLLEHGANVVSLDIIPDWAGAGYDAFVVPSQANGTIPAAATNTTGPGLNDNNVTVEAGVPVTFVITNLDTAVLENFTGNVASSFTIYNDTDNGQVASHYSLGQSIQDLPIGHTFSIDSLNLNIPIPPDTVVTFTYTFTNPGVYQYMCETPCGPGMGLPGYMSGYVIVTSP